MNLETPLDYDSKYSPEIFTALVQADVGSIKSQLFSNPEFFINFFIPNELEFPVPQFHIDVFSRMTNEELQRMLLAIPRGHAKTTLAKLAIVWYFLFSKHRFAIYLSNTSPIAKNACRDIINFLQSENFINVFGKIQMEKESETEGLWIFMLGQKRCILRAAGANQQMRGINVDNSRPDIAVVDDLEDFENTTGPVLQKKLDRWVLGTFIKALAKSHKLIWIGNMLSNTCLLFRLSQRANWNPIVLGSLVMKGEVVLPLWPDRWTIESLIEDFQEYQDLGNGDVWLAEMMNMPTAGDNSFAASSIRYMPARTLDEVRVSFITIDPAFGQEARNDNSGIAVHAVIDDAPIQVVDTFLGKVSEDQLFLEALNLAYQWNCWIWGIEGNAAQKVLLTLFELYKIEHHVEQLELVKLISGKEKAERISSWVGLMRQGMWAATDGDTEITSQLLIYDKNKRDNNDDLIDACAHGVQMAEEHWGEIIAAWNPMERDNPPTIRTGLELCHV